MGRRARVARRPRRRRLWPRLLALLALLLAAPALPLACVRVVDPPWTALMLERSLEARAEGRAYRVFRRPVPLHAVSPSLRLAVVAAEDQRFPLHRGFDFEQVRGALEDAGGGRRLRGASTITQQTCKNLFLWSGRSWVRKALEAWLTVLAETVLPKRRILELYLNAVELGDGVFGVEAASLRFFGKRAAELDAGEAALLAAALPNPHRLRLSDPAAELRGRAAAVRAHMRRLGPRWVAGL